jgi:SAM-dependent methyltransferase
VEISEHAVARAQERFDAAGLPSDLRLISAGQPLPYADSLFDVTYAWQVLYYGDRQRWASTVGELERVTTRGGLIILATAAPGDISQVEAEPLGNHMYRSKVAGQEGCVLTIPDRQEISQLLPGRQLEIGEFGFRFGTTTARYWIITYRILTP